MAAHKKQLAPPSEPSTGPDLSRRTFVQAGVGATAFLGALSSTHADAAPATRRRGGEERDAVRWLVHHTNQGFDLAELERAREMGYEDYLDEQLAPQDIDDAALDERLAAYPSLTMSTKELYDAFIPTGRVRDAAAELRQATVLRSILSKRQLYERMVQFWSDHFNIDQNKNLCMYLKTVDDRDVIRANALGSFGAMVHASARSSAMLLYLDNYSNVAKAPNENYARELMELHTLGVDGGYSEEDVYEVARCFTGWTFEWVEQPDHGAFRFRPMTHDKDPKTVLNQTLEGNNRTADGEKVINMLVASPVTARFAAGKLANWLLAYDPPEAVIEAAVKAYLDSEGQIEPMVRAILARPTVEALLASGHEPKLRRPRHFAVSLVRSTGARVDGTAGLVDELRDMGQEPFCWPTPDGYADALANWGDSVFPRWRFATRLLGGEVAGVTVDPETCFALQGGFEPSRGAEQIDLALTGGTLSASDRAALQRFLDAQESVGETELRHALALAASSPSYQYY